MAINIIMPALGVAQQTGTLLKWLKAEGESVVKGEPIMEVESDKATVEVEATGSGVLSSVTAKPGDVVPVGAAVAVLLAPGEKASTAMSSHPNPLSAGEGTISAVSPTLPARPLGEPRLSHVEGGRAEDHKAARQAGKLLASPAAKRIAKEKSIDITSVGGTGPDGSIVARDLVAALPGAQPPESKPSTGEIIPLTAMRRIVGQRMTQSKQSAPHFYLSMDVDMTAVDKLRSEAKQRGGETIPSINDYILYACARSLKDFRSLNATFTEHGIKLHNNINLGVAVALEEGLVVPVIRNAEQKSLTELAQQSRQLAEKAQSKKLFPLDYDGGTFTVSNLGMLGVDSFTAIINPPQCAILAVGRVAPRVIADDGMFAIKSMMTATLSADHRVIDGAMAARFLGAVKRALEAPTK